MTKVADVVFLSLRETITIYQNWTDFFTDCPNQDFVTPDTAWHYVEKYAGHRIIAHEALPMESYQRLKMLLSPNYKTVLTVWCIKNGIEWK